MVRSVLISSLVVLVSTFCSIAQSFPGAVDCMEPLPQRVDEFVFTSNEDLAKRTARFLEAIEMASGPAAGWVNVFGGRIATSNEIE